MRGVKSACEASRIARILLTYPVPQHMSSILSSLWCAFGSSELRSDEVKGEVELAVEGPSSDPRLSTSNRPSSLLKAALSIYNTLRLHSSVSVLGIKVGGRHLTSIRPKGCDPKM